MTAPSTSMAMDKPEYLTSMEAVLEVLNEGVVITDEHQQILSVNSRFIEMTAFPGRTSSDLTVLNSILRRSGILSPGRFMSSFNTDRTAMLLFFLERTVAVCPSSSARGSS